METLLLKLKNTLNPSRDLCLEAARAIESLMTEGPRKRSHFVPEGWQPNPLMERQAGIRPGPERDGELYKFRLHEFANPRSDWDRCWILWWKRSQERGHVKNTERVTAETSQHPALVAERRLRQATKIGDM